MFSVNVQILHNKANKQKFILIRKQEEKYLSASACFSRGTGLSSPRIFKIKSGTRILSVPLSKPLSEHAVLMLESMRTDLAI